jgi:hypothetical protein
MLRIPFMFQHYVIEIPKSKWLNPQDLKKYLPNQD